MSISRMNYQVSVFTGLNVEGTPVLKFNMKGWNESVLPGELYLK